MAQSHLQDRFWSIVPQKTITVKKIQLERSGQAIDMMTADQCDQMVRLFLQYLFIYSNEN